MERLVALLGFPCLQLRENDIPDALMWRSIGSIRSARSFLIQSVRRQTRARPKKSALQLSRMAVRRAGLSPLVNLCDCSIRKSPHSEDMAINALHLVGLAALILLTAGANLRYGALIAVGVCMFGAVALELVAP